MIIQGNLMKLDAIFFDFDGVLVDSVFIKEKAFGQLYAEYGSEVMEKVMLHHRCHGGVSRFEKFQYYHREFLGKELSQDDINDLNNQFSTLVMELVINAEELPGAEQTLRALSGYLPLHLISASPNLELKQIVKARKMDHYFQSIHGSPMQKHEHMLNIIEQCGYKEQNILMIGDSINDYEASLKAGVYFLGYVSSSLRSPFSADVSIISNMTQIISMSVSDSSYEVIH